MKKTFTALFALFILAAWCASCDRKEAAKVNSAKLHIVTTLFPLYDFARTVAGDRAEVVLLLPPGMEAHSFEPTPEDILKINKSDLFIYTNRQMEPWAADIIGGTAKLKSEAVDASRGCLFLKAGREDDHDNDGEHHDHHAEGRGHHHAGGMDPHIWLDLENARRMVENIRAAMVARDPKNESWYNANAKSYSSKLADLDGRYKAGLSTCGKKVFFHGGHYAFGYLAHRYGLQYASAYAISADAEPSPARLAELIRQIKTANIHYIYTEELVEPRVADTIGREAGAKVLKLHGAHNISRDDLKANVTFISLMEQNLKNLRIGLECR
jgi:zinc transport system substrate-binding protein